jgi:2-desacetyl-2-hydroxyethyl bacteriochlorophyllide A dehydrogenase
MERAVRFVSPGRVDVVPSDRLTAGAGQVRVRTLYSGISAGTELTAFRGTNPYLHRTWDAEQRLFHDGGGSVGYPIEGWGYEEVGEVVELGPGADPDLLGSVVWGLWGHRSDAVLPAEQASAQRLPSGADPLSGIFARVGAVALNAVVEADIHVGETVAIFGQGVIGLLAARLAVLSGARVVAVDADPGRLERSSAYGVQTVLPALGQQVAETVRDMTEGRGADVCIELSGSYAALQEALRTSCYSGRVVVGGFYQGEATGLRLGEEFHHNRIEIVASQISGGPARYAHRWTPRRLHLDFMRLVAEGSVDPLPLITGVFPIDEVSEAFAMLDEGKTDVLQTVLKF